MANLCEFDMKILGKDKNVKDFYNALIQKGSIWLGRGANCTLEKEDAGKYIIFGDVKWSISRALVDDALTMKAQKETGKGLWGGIDKNTKTEFLTIWDACKKFNLTVEIISCESGLEIAEHYLFRNGKLELSERTNYSEYFLCDYDTKKDAEDDLGIEISNEEWENEEYITRGGFEKWVLDGNPKF